MPQQDSKTDRRAVVRLYNKRGTAEQWITEGKQSVKMTRLSCHRFRSNEVRLWLSLIAYNLGNLWRRLVLPREIENWSLTSLQQRLAKTGGRLVKHARYYWLMVPRALSHGGCLGAWSDGSKRSRWRLGSRRAVTTAKSGDQDVEVGDVFVEINEKTQFPVFGFSVGGIWCLAEAKEGSRRKNCASEDQDLGVCDLLKPNPGAKMEILVRMASGAYE